MTVSATNLDSGGTGNNPTTIVTNSVSPGSNNLLLLLVDITRNDSTTPAVPSSISGLGLTWATVDSSQYDTAGIGRRTAVLYRALGTPSTGAITVTLGYTANKCTWQLSELSNVDTSGTNGSGAIVQNVKSTGTTNSPATTLAAFANANNATYGALGGGFTSTSETFTAGSGFAQIGTGAAALNNQASASHAEFRNDNDTSVDCTVSSGVNGWVMFGVEIKAGVVTVTGTLARTLADATVVAAGSSTTGTLARTLADSTVVASGSSVTGTLARTLADATVVASGDVGAVTGTLAVTLADATVSASGSTVTGTLARTLANATVSASGTASAPAFVGPDVYVKLFTLGDSGIEGPTASSGTHSRSWEEQVSQAGAGSLIFQDDDPLLDALTQDGNDLIAFYYRDEFAFLMRALGFEDVELDEAGESAQATMVSGPGALGLLSKAVVYPTNGTGRLPKETDRYFNWASPVYDDSSSPWTTPTNLGTVDAARFDQFVNVSWIALFIDSPAQYAAEFLDGTAECLWASGGTFTSGKPVGDSGGDCYFRQEFTVANAGVHTVHLATDDIGEALVDGQRITAVTAPNFLSTSSGTVQLSAGTHLLAVHVHNRSDSEVFDPARNPGFGAWAVYDEAMNLVMHSDHTDAKIAPYQSDPPGMAIGQVLDICMDEWEDRLGHVIFQRGWSATNDSNGNAWPVVADVGTKVNNDYLTFFSGELGSTYIDLWYEFDPDTATLTLHACNLGDHDDAPAVGYTAGVNVAKLARKVEANPVTAMLIDSGAGWIERTDTGAITAHGRSEAALDLGSINSTAEVGRISDAQFDIFKHPRQEITAGVRWPRDSDPIAYTDYHLGDTISTPDGDQRVVALSVTEDNDTGRATVVPTFSDVILDAEERVLQNMKKLANGNFMGSSAVGQSSSAAADRSTRAPSPLPQSGPVIGTLFATSSSSGPVNNASVTLTWDTITSTNDDYSQSGGSTTTLRPPKGSLCVATLSIIWSLSVVKGYVQIAGLANGDLFEDVNTSTAGYFTMSFLVAPADSFTVTFENRSGFTAGFLVPPTLQMRGIA